MKTLLFISFVSLAVWALPSINHAARPKGIEVKDAIHEEVVRLQTAKGGSLTLEPSILFPIGKLEDAFYPAPGANINFDVGVSPHVSWVFGAGAYDFHSKQNPDLRLRLLPGWMGLRWKYRMVPTVETYWELAGSAYYEYLTYQNDVAAKQEYLTAGGVASSGLNVWFTSWLISGVQTRIHFIVEQGVLYPMMQFGLFIGVRG